MSFTPRFSARALSPEVVQKLAVQGGGPAGTSPQAFGLFLKDESSRWLALAREVNITAD